MVNKMKFGVMYAYWAGGDWRCDFIDLVKRAAGANCDVLEIGAAQLLEMPGSRRCYLKDLAEERGVYLTTNLGPPQNKNLASTDAAVRKNAIEFLKEILCAMNDISSHELVGVLHTYWPCKFEMEDLQKERALAHAVTGMKTVADIAGYYGINCCIEVVNRFESNLINTGEEALLFCRAIDKKNVKILLDTFHMNIEEDDMLQTIRNVSDYLGHFHVGENNRRLPGQGNMNWSGIGKLLKDLNYEGCVIAEPFVHSGGDIGRDIKVWRDLRPGISPQEMDQELEVSINFLREKFNTE